MNRPCSHQSRAGRWRGVLLAVVHLALPGLGWAEAALPTPTPSPLYAALFDGGRTWTYLLGHDFASEFTTDLAAARAVCTVRRVRPFPGGAVASLVRCRVEDPARTLDDDTAAADQLRDTVTPDGAYVATARGLWRTERLPASADDVARVTAQPPFLPATPAEPRVPPVPDDWVARRGVYLPDDDVRGWCRTEQPPRAEDGLPQPRSVACFAAPYGPVQLGWDDGWHIDLRSWLVETTAPGAAGTPPPPTPAPAVGGESPRPALAWIALPGGTFRMGTRARPVPEDEAPFAPADDEAPPHAVTVSSFAILRTEVTVGEYRACVAAGRCTLPGGGPACNASHADRDDHPVNCVVRNQARAFCAWAGGRLPTEAEWEYAARGVTGRLYPWGKEPPRCERAVMRAGTDTAERGCGRGGTWPVCSRPSGRTPEGLCDMAGNVWEWVADWYGAYGRRAATDPTGPTTGFGGVLRGGGFESSAEALRGAERYGLPAYGDESGYGFRCVRAPSEGR